MSSAQSMKEPIVDSSRREPSRDCLRFVVDGSSPARRLDHHWELALGGPHATFALRVDFQEQLRRCRRELGVEHLRCHLGLSQGPAVAMLENHRTGLLWRLTRGMPAVRRGLERAGFTGGWLRP
jgi:hypothetical protein